MTLETIIECLEKEHFCDSCPNQDSECTGYSCVYVNAVKLINTQQSEIDRLQQENEQLKELLRLAVGDMSISWLCAVCSKRTKGKEWAMCRFLKFDSDFGEEHSTTCTNFEWRHSDKMKGLIEL